ncbi:MAG: bifunctional riboflavin kinase/FAD synthetase [Rhodospirillaceae bacterium]
MRLFRSYLDLPDSARGSVTVLGNFDGVHRGHQSVIACGAGIARDMGVSLAVLTFEPHPRSVFRPADRPFRLTPFRIKERQLEALGIDSLVVCHFDESFQQRSADNFVGEILASSLECRHVVTGTGFRFGHRRAGDLDLLARQGRICGFGVTGVGMELDETGKVLSSTRVREALAAGRPREAAYVLGRAWEIEGRVEAGNRLGRTLGFPTANLSLGEYVRPAFGAYAVRAGIDAGLSTCWHDGVANLGCRPTVAGTEERLEVHLFAFDDDLYGRHLRVQLIEFLRPEQRFESLEALKRQITLDLEAARTALRVSGA